MKQLLWALAAAAAALAACNKSEIITVDDKTPLCKVYEYTPAPGQFINENFTANTPAEACAWAEGRLNSKSLAAYVSLGGFGGYIVVGFGEPIPSGGAGVKDIEILGNSFDGSSEPGIVWVMRDDNGNGVPDDVWYELRGSEYDSPQTIFGYEVTYTRPEEGQPVAWRDNLGGEGTIDRMTQHRQEYYPAWISNDSYTLRGTRLPDNVRLDPDMSTDGNPYWVRYAFEYGYVDNEGSDAGRFSIADAVDASGAPAGLERIDFIKIQTGVNSKSGALGEVSTEVCRVTNLHAR
ncbi:MAG: hypothetical protein J1D86_01005 [Alistipes sp.]|nr:hypothetical protein [Alistipes sp.]